MSIVFKAQALTPASRVIRGLGTTLLLAALVGGFWQTNASAGEQAVKLPPPEVTAKATAKADSQTAVLAGGCFWGMEAVFQHVRGVTNVVSGYSGGSADTASYQAVSTGSTGHAESVRITYDPREIGYARILQIYFSVAHNPTELNRQGPDVGPQYRSDIFYANDRQKRIARAYITQLDNADVFQQPIVTRIDPLTAFYPAEAHHQNFMHQNPNYPYIVINDLPKVKSVQRLFPAIYRDTPVLVAAK